MGRRRSGGLNIDLGSIIWYGVIGLFFFNMCSSDETKLEVSTTINEVKTEVSESISPELKGDLAKLASDAKAVGKQIAAEIEKSRVEVAADEMNEKLKDSNLVAVVIDEKTIDIQDKDSEEPITYEEMEKMEAIEANGNEVTPVDYGGMVLTPKL